MEYTKTDYENMRNNNYYSHSTDIARALCSLADNIRLYDDIEQELYNLHANCQNQHNRDSIRILYAALAEISERYYMEQIQEG